MKLAPRARPRLFARERPKREFSEITNFENGDNAALYGIGPVRLRGTENRHKGFSKVPFGSRIAEGSEAAVCDGFGEGEVVSSEEIDMSPNQRREVGDIGIVAAHALSRDLAKGFLHIDGVRFRAIGGRRKCIM